MLDAQEDYPHVRKPIVYFLCWRCLNDFQDHILYLLAIDTSIGHAGPVVVTFVEIIPVHLIDSDSEHLLEVFIDAMGNYSMVNKLIYVDSGGMAEVEDEWMP